MKLAPRNPGNFGITAIITSKGSNAMISCPMSDCPQSTTDCRRVSAQIELTPDGDFVSRSNDVETVWRRIDPDDWDGDGNLSVEETAYVFGYDCSSWFERTTETSTETGTPVGNATRLERTFILNRRKVRACWNMTKVTRRGFGTFGESATIRGRLPGFKLSIQ